MYESRFGITLPPFQIGPDPKFYFESGAHREAMAQLRAGLLADSGFVVLSGEVGAGKTLLAKRFVAELSSTMAVVQINSSQLHPDELLTAIAHGYGVGQVPGATAEARLRELHRLLRRVDREHRRALLVIDEAQHLSDAALLCLVKLVAPTLMRPMPLQVCLVGQPELREHLDSAALHELRRRIRASAHLLGLEPDETGRYIEHRLRLAGWSGTPSFEPEAHGEIHRQTGGIPRLVNRLCNRLLLSRFLGGEPVIDLASVRETAQSIHAEIGNDAGTTTSPGLLHDGARREPRSGAWLPGGGSGAVWCVAAGRSDHAKAALLMRSLQAQEGMPPAMLVRTQDNDALALSRSLFGDRLPPHGRLPGYPGGAGAALGTAIDRDPPGAVVVFGGDDPAWECAAAARGRGIATFHVDAVLPYALPPVESLADLFFCTDSLASEELADAGVPADRLRVVGSLLTDAIHAALDTDVPAPAAVSLPPGAQYALAAWGHPQNIADRQVLTDMLAIVRDVSRDVPVVWLLDPPLAAQMARYRLDLAMAGERVTIAPPQPHAAWVTLLSRAACVLTDSWGIQEEATALGVPCLTFGRVLERPVTSEFGSNVPIGLNRGLATRWLWDCLFNGGRQGHAPEHWDGHAAGRIAADLAGVLQPPNSPA